MTDSSAPTDTKVSSKRKTTCDSSLSSSTSNGSNGAKKKKSRGLEEEKVHTSSVDSSTALIERCRAQFPALKNSGWTFMENAGGSQLPKQVADAVHQYLLTSYVQIGAGYEVSDRATKNVESAHEFATLIMNAVEGQVILGPSSTVLINNLANAYASELKAGDEVIVSQDGHEANIGPWVRLGEKVSGVNVRFWTLDAKTYEMKLETLESLLSSKTRLVSVTHVSNVLGEVRPIKEIVQLVRRKAPRARVIADGVAYSAHRLIDVQDWGIDYYFYSCYKAYGPHMAAMYMRHEAAKEVTGPNHFFIPRDLAYKWELGGVLHEGCAGLLALKKYLNVILDRDPDTVIDRQAIAKAWNIMTELEKPLVHKLLSYLKSKVGIRVIGASDPDSPSRVPTICFAHNSVKAEIIAKRVHSAKIGVRYGRMYCPRMEEALDITDDGVVRVSLVHYNTLAELDDLIRAIDESLS